MAMTMPTPPVLITDFEPAETLALVRMWRASFEHGVGIVDPHPIEQQVAYFETTVRGANHVHVARAGGAMVGFMACTRGSVAQLYVHVDHLGRGVGTLLLQRAKQDSGGSLWLHTFARNRRARRFYEHHGFAAAAFGFEPFWQLDDVRYEWLAA